MASIALPPRMTEELDALISAGYYDNKSEVMREAFRLFLAKKTELRIAIALELYKKGKATISRVAEIAGMPYEDVKSLLIAEGLLKRGIDGDASGLAKRARKLHELVE